MLSSEECRDKIEELSFLIKRYKEGTASYEEEVPHLERLRKAYTYELSNALRREATRMHD